MPHDERFLAMIVPVDPSTRPEHPIHYPPPGGGTGIWGPDDPRPTPPIVIPPSAIAPGVPTHPIYLPVYPAHPIVIPPGAIGPGLPTHPIELPPYHPAHPIVIPPDSVAPGVPTHPIYLPPRIWGGGNVPFPTPPIYIPPPPPDPPHAPAEMPPAGFLWAYAFVPVIASWLYVAVAEQAMPHVEHHGGEGAKRK